jgi:hypothetical protein
MHRSRLFAVFAAVLLAVATTGCLLDVQPETATNPAGTEHTVTATLLNPELVDQEEFCVNLIAAIEGLSEEDFEDFSDLELSILFGIAGSCQLDEQGGVPPLGTTDHNPINFEILSGPNAGLNSDQDGVCEPSCESFSTDFEYDWTYDSNGAAGTDVIEVCIGGEAPSSEEIAQIEGGPLEELLLGVINDTLGGDYYRSVFDFFCQTVEKTWIENTPTPEPTEKPRERIERSVPNIGAGLSGLFAGQPTPLPTAAAPAPAAPSQGIRPPNTGDAGLR